MFKSRSCDFFVFNCGNHARTMQTFLRCQILTSHGHSFYDSCYCKDTCKESCYESIEFFLLYKRPDKAHTSFSMRHKIGYLLLNHEHGNKLYSFVCKQKAVVSTMNKPIISQITFWNKWIITSQALIMTLFYLKISEISKCSLAAEKPSLMCACVFRTYKRHCCQGKANPCEYSV